MEWIQVFTIIGVLGAFIVWMFQKLDSDIKSANTSVNSKIDTLDNDIKQAHRRMDQLYQVIIDLIKSK